MVNQSADDTLKMKCLIDLCLLCVKGPAFKVKTAYLQKCAFYGLIAASTSQVLPSNYLFSIAILTASIHIITNLLVRSET